MARRLDDVRLAVLMLDGVEFKGRTNIVALGIRTEGVKIPLGLWEGSTVRHPGAAASLREGIAETLTLTLLGISGSLKRTLASTNPCESMIECVRRTVSQRQALVFR